MMDEVGPAELEILARLAWAADSRDADTREHIARVAAYVTVIAKGLGLDQIECEMLGFASTMHDVGKLGVPDAILFKQGPLTEEERAEIERHAEMGHRILEGSPSEPVRLAAEIALSHHERWDGAGYPRKLSGEEIPLSARIVAVADVFDALTSARPYKKAWPVEDAFKFLKEQAGTHFDPRCVDAFIEQWDAFLAAQPAQGTAEP